MPSFGDSAFIFFLALLLFGPKKLPELARQLGKLMAEFRRASNEFRIQMEEELRISDQAEKQKQIAAIEAAAPPAALVPASETTPELTAGTATEPTEPTEPHPYFPPAEPAPEAAAARETASVPETLAASETTAAFEPPPPPDRHTTPAVTAEPAPSPKTLPAAETVPPETPVTPVPIATSGELSILPPATGLPTPRSSSLAAANQAAAPDLTPEPAATEETLHG